MNAIKRTISGRKAAMTMAALLLMVMAAGCGGSGESGSPDASEAEAELRDQMTDTVVNPQFGRGFVVLGASEGDLKGAMLLEVKNPWQGAQGESRTLLLLPEGVKAPAGYDGMTAKWPSERLVVMSSTFAAMLDAIGGADRIVGASGKRHFSSGSVRSRLDEIAEVGYEGNVDYEALAGARPDLVLLYGVSAANPMEAKLREMGIPYIYIGDYLEEDPLGKAEWMLAMGAITGRLEKAREAFAPIVTSYLQTAGMVSSFAKKPYPKVMINNTTGDGWFMPGGNSYMVKLIEDAGGEYIYKKNPGTKSKVIGLEEAWSLMSESDYWLNPGTASSMRELKGAEPRMMDTPPAKRGNVWNNTLRMNAEGGMDFYESGAVRPHRVLLDLVGIFHPELTDSTRRAVYYRHLE